jgi:heptosyltransferase II
MDLNENGGTCRNILIVKFGALGDVVRTSYMLPALAGKYPGARIHWLTADGAREVLEFNPHVYRVASPGMGYDIVQATEFDLALSLDDEMEVLERLARLHVKRVIGARLEHGKRTYCDASAPWFDMGLISRFGKVKADELKRANAREHHSFLEEMLGVTIGSATFYNSPDLERHEKDKFSAGRFHGGVNSGSGARWPSKQLPLVETAELVRELVSWRVNRKPVLVWLLGGREEESRHQAICRLVDSSDVIDPGYTKTIMQFAARIKALDYLITTDSLALHLGISQQVPNLSVYAPTSAAEIGTFGTGTKVVSTAADYCSYRPNADNSSITSIRILEALRAHCAQNGWTVESC